MKSLRFTIGLASLAILAAAAIAANDPQAPKYKQVRTQIEMLFGNRNVAAAHKPIVENPFRVGSETGAAQSTPANDSTQSGPLPPPPITSEEEQLKAAVGTFGNIGTSVLRGGQAAVFINGRAYGEGASISVRIPNGQNVLLRVKKIAPGATGQRGAVTFGLNDLEITVSL